MTAPQTFNIPSKPVTKGATGIGSQRDRRFTDTFHDRHKHPIRFPNGRPFTGEREFQSGNTEESVSAGFLSSDLQCGEYFCENPREGQTLQERADSLSSAWSAPWIPVSKYFKFNYRQKIITLDYVRGRTDEKASLDKFYRAAAKLAGANGWGEIKYGVVPSYQVTAVLGEPSPFLPIWEAAIAGDPWLLGFVDEPNERLAQALGLDISYVAGARSADSEYVAVQRQAAPEPLITPDKVLATPMEQIGQMIADAVQAAMDKRDAEKKVEAQVRMANARSKRRVA
jgi:hypothetical protein